MLYSVSCLYAIKVFEKHCFAVFFRTQIVLAVINSRLYKIILYVICDFVITGFLWLNNICDVLDVTVIPCQFFRSSAARVQWR